MMMTREEAIKVLEAIEGQIQNVSLNWDVMLEGSDRSSFGFGTTPTYKFFVISGGSFGAMNDAFNAAGLSVVQYGIDPDNFPDLYARWAAHEKGMGGTAFSIRPVTLGKVAQVRAMLQSTITKLRAQVVAPQSPIATAAIVGTKPCRRWLPYAVAGGVAVTATIVIAVLATRKKKRR